MKTSGAFTAPTGHVFRVERKRGPQWYANYFTKRLAEAWLRSTPDEARRGTLPGMVRTGASFADAAAEYLRYIGEDRAR